jgi:XTP/dITP diphosphohydrolase
VRELVAATRNPNKFAEVAAILEDTGMRVLALDEFPEAPDVEEDGETFEENASKKAEAATHATGRAAIADDSGLCVDALGGAPGVRSARYAGEEADHAANNAKLLRALEGVPDGERTARFACVIALASPGRETVLFRGECRGRITREPRGGGGFGYDPLFYSPELGRTFAEAPPEEKNRVSHRARALAALRSRLAAAGARESSDRPPEGRS